MRDRVGHLAASYANDIVVRCIDIRRLDYWVMENDGTLWIERSAERLDTRLCSKDELLFRTEAA